MSAPIQVRFCPSGEPTVDEWRAFREVPRRGEIVERTAEAGVYVVVDVEWGVDGEPFVIAHGLDRPRAQALRG